jgi:hypothetical protein
MVKLGNWIDPVTGDKFGMNNHIRVIDTHLTRYGPLLAGATA